MWKEKQLFTVCNVPNTAVSISHVSYHFIYITLTAIAINAYIYNTERTGILSNLLKDTQSAVAVLESDPLFFTTLTFFATAS